MNLREVVEKIGPEDQGAREEAHRRWSACAKPLGGLGFLETVVENVAALTGIAAVDFSHRALLVLCADNGVVAQGVTQSPSSVTAAVAGNLAAGRSSVCMMAKVARCRVVPVDMGILDFSGLPGLLDRRMGNGTQDISVGPAMTRRQAEQAVLTGIELVREQQEQGCRLLATGEMGIGNTTTSSAVACMLLGRQVQELTGRGAGLSDQGLRRKIEVIRRAIAVNRPDPEDPLDVLSKLGGFDIAGLCGIFLGGALYGIPVLIDGVISSAAALCAERLCPNSAKAMVASHVSQEPASRLLLEVLGKRPLITAGMHLGEGTGAVAAIPLLDMALAVYQGSSTFDETGIEAYQPLGGQP